MLAKLKELLQASCCCCCCKPEIEDTPREVPQQDGGGESITNRRASSGLSDPEKMPPSPSRRSPSSFFPLRRRSRHSKGDSWSTTTSQFEHPAVRPLSSILRPRTPGQRPPLYSKGSWSSESLTIEDEKLAAFFNRVPISERREPLGVPNQPISPDDQIRESLLLLAEGTPLNRRRDLEMIGFEPEKKARSRLPTVQENLRSSIYCVCRSRPLSACSISTFQESVYYSRPPIRAEISIGLI